MKIAIVGSLRGFFKHLISNPPMDTEFLYENKTYEIASKKKVLISYLLRSKVIGFLGIYKTVDAVGKSQEADCYFSFNRFLNSDKPYYIYLENPTALCNYSLTCLKSPFVKKKLLKSLNDKNLKKIICMSKACQETLEKVLDVEIDDDKVVKIYPYVPNNTYVNEDSIRERCKQDTIKLLFIAQGFRFYSKGGKEVILAYEKLKTNSNIEMTIITNIECLDDETKEKINECGIKLLNFKFSYEEMEKIYASHHILLQPSSDDSFSLTVVEAMKAGLPIIASDMYGFKEMVSDGVNGYLIAPAFRFFDENDIPNPKVWNNRKKTIYSMKVCKGLVDEIINATLKVISNKEELYQYSINSYKRGNSVFSKEKILNKWNEVFKNAKG